MTATPDRIIALRLYFTEVQILCKLRDALPVRGEAWTNYEQAISDRCAAIDAIEEDGGTLAVMARRGEKPWWL